MLLPAIQSAREAAGRSSDIEDMDTFDFGDGAGGTTSTIGRPKLIIADEPVGEQTSQDGPVWIDTVGFNPQPEPPAYDFMF